MSEASFDIAWQIDPDGTSYLGPRLRHVTIHASEISPEMNEFDLRDLAWKKINEDFEAKVYPVSSQAEQFVAWAREQQQKRGK